MVAIYSSRQSSPPRTEPRLLFCLSRFFTPERYFTLNLSLFYSLDTISTVARAAMFSGAYHIFETRKNISHLEK